MIALSRFTLFLWALCDDLVEIHLCVCVWHGGAFKSVRVPVVCETHPRRFFLQTAIVAMAPSANDRTEISSRINKKPMHTGSSIEVPQGRMLADDAATRTRTHVNRHARESMYGSGGLAQPHPALSLLHMNGCLPNLSHPVVTSVWEGSVIVVHARHWVHHTHRPSRQKLIRPDVASLSFAVNQLHTGGGGLCRTRLAL